MHPAQLWSCLAGDLTFKSLLDVNRLLGARLEVRYAAILLAESLGPLLRDHSLAFFNIDLVTKQYLVACQNCAPRARLTVMSTYKGE